MNTLTSGRQLKNSLSITVVVLVLTGIAAVSWITIKEFRVQQTVYTKILQQKLDSTRSQFRMYLAPFPNFLHTLQLWEQSGMLDLEDSAGLEKLIIPLVDSTTQVASVYLIPPSGEYFCLTRTDDGWQSSLLDEKEPTCRTQSWYQDCLKNPTKPLHWSEYVFLPVLGEVGLVAGANGDSLVIGLGIRETNLDQFTAEAPITENGIFIRRNKDGNVVWVSPKHDNRMNINTSEELLVSSLPELQIIGRALMAWGENGQTYEAPFKFRRNGETWWGTFYPPLESTDPGDLGLIAPASDLGRRLESVTGWVTWIFAAVLGLAMLAVVMQAFAYSSKWRRFTQRRLKAPQSEEELQELVFQGESDQVEFKSTMRWNLHTDKPGKEIEKAWLKSVVAYLNTRGGFLLIGVADDGEILGLEGDKFKNEDKFLLHFDNLIKQHIGLQFASYINAEIRTLGQQQIFLVACDRCPEPVYLKIAEAEDFFIRMGPSTRSLPGSRVMGYLKERAE